MSERERADLFDVVVVGSLNVDLVVRAARHPAPGETLLGSSYQEFPGGKGLNQAVAAARAGAKVALVGAVGNDAAGAFLRSVVRDEGIDDRWIATVPDLPSGRAIIVVDDHAENSIVVVSGANQAARFESVGAPEAAVVLAQLEVPIAVVDEAFVHARARNSLTILNPAPAQPLPASMVANCSVIVPNEHEVALVGGPDRLLGGGAGTIITTKGANGVAVDTPTSHDSVAAFVVTPVDTTGAGDAFCGNLAARLAAGDDLLVAARFAAAAGALATTREGAVPSLPRFDEVLSLAAS